MRKFDERQQHLNSATEMTKGAGFNHRGEKLHVFFGHGVDDSKVCHSCKSALSDFNSLKTESLQVLMHYLIAKR